MHFLLTVKTRTQVQFQYIHLKYILKKSHRSSFSPFSYFSLLGEMNGCSSRVLHAVLCNV